jgi:hypothetical protein
VGEDITGRRKSFFDETPLSVLPSRIAHRRVKPSQVSTLFKLSVLTLAMTSSSVAEVILPTGGNIVTGAGTINQAGSSMTIRGGPL